MTNLYACLIVSLLGLYYVPASPNDSVGMMKMALAIVIVLAAWILFFLGRS